MLAYQETGQWQQYPLRAHTHTHAHSHTCTVTHTLHDLCHLLWQKGTTDPVTYTIWAHFVYVNFQHTKILSFSFSNGHKYLCVSLVTSSCCSVSFCIVLCVVSALNSETVQSEALQIWAFTIFSRSHVKIIVRLFSLRTKWNGKELIEKVPKQWGNKCSCQDKHLSLLFPDLLPITSIAAGNFQ